MALDIDNAWQIEPARHLRYGGPNCAHLLTARNQRQAQADLIDPVHRLQLAALHRLLRWMDRITASYSRRTGCVPPGSTGGCDKRPGPVQQLQVGDFVT